MFGDTWDSLMGRMLKGESWTVPGLQLMHWEDRLLSVATEAQSPGRSKPRCVPCSPPQPLFAGLSLNARGVGIPGAVPAAFLSAGRVPPPAPRRPSTS